MAVTVMSGAHFMAAGCLYPPSPPYDAIVTDIHCSAHVNAESSILAGGWAADPTLSSLLLSTNTALSHVFEIGMLERRMHAMTRLLYTNHNNASYTFIRKDVSTAMALQGDPSLPPQSAIMLDASTALV